MNQKKQNQIAAGIVVTIGVITLGYFAGVFTWTPTNPLPDVVVIKIK